MSSATMHFGPEWMRSKNQPHSRSQQQPSPPPANALPQAPTLATYSALVSVTPASEKLDESRPFRYSKEELLTIYQEGGKGGLGLEVDRWQGVIREVAVEPVTLREMTDAEKKLFAGPLNSEIRRRPSQSTDHFSPLNISVSERHRMMPGGSVTGSRERFSGMKRKDSAGGTADSTSMPKKPSLSTLQVPGVLSPTSPRTRVGYNSNFDGVLNNGESWMARRRFSEVSLKVSSTEIQGEDSKPKGIAEVKEEEFATAVHVCKEEEATFLSQTSAGIDSAISASHSGISVTKDIADNITGTVSLPATHRDYQEVGQSPVILDLAAVEWSYKDPTGQVQGPFRADLMQKWYEEGYFTPDLPMKRTLLDSQWFTVQELVTQAAGASVFLTPPLQVGPPGLNRQSSLRTPEHSHKEPFQPAPIRSLRTSTLESSLTGASLASDPPSSLGAPQLVESSPEHSALIGRDKRPYGSIGADGRIPGFGLQDMSTPGFISTRLNSNRFVHDLSTQSSGNFVPDLDIGLDVGLNGHVFNNHPPKVQDSWTAFPHSSFGLPNANLTTPHGVPPTNRFNDSVARGYFESGGSNQHSNLGGPQSGTMVSNPVNYTCHELAGTTPFTGLVNQQSYAAQIPNFDHLQLGQPSDPRMQESTSPHVPSIHNGLPSGQSTWNTIPDSRMHASMAVERLEPTNPHGSGVLNGVAIRGTLLDEASGNNFNAEVDGRHTAPPELAQLLDERVEQDSRTASTSNTTSEASSVSGTVKFSTKTSKPLDQDTLSDDPLTQAPAKSAWTKDDAVKGKKATTTSISLREIQEAEARKRQSLKATEREKERTRAGNTSEVKEDAQSFTTSWGLPTSQAGARSNAHLPAKDVPVSSAASIQPSPVSAVWTTTAKPAVIKKSMKEIQEEEEKRKRQAARDNSVTVTPKRAYAESSSKTTPSPSSAPNTNPWATVGPNGKPISPSQPSRAPVHTTSFSLAVSGPSAVSRSTATLNQRIATTPPITMRPVITKPGEVPEVPSHEFLKWLGESLKGVNSSANVEEIMSMLFSFPLDPDSSTLEIISDTIYANSTTLDGRRFAADFVAKRKADAAARCKGPADSGKAAGNKPVSIADVVKAVPKSTQPEWGFKVVNKKRKGGRS